MFDDNWSTFFCFAWLHLAALNCAGRNDCLEASAGKYSVVVS